jgi:NAD(P)-dependent dehydrogenase (short-subunit alcohol dehydrogenase family)
MELRGKVGVVTGGASGIGRGMGLALAARGSHVVVADVDETRAAEVAREIAAKGVRTLAVGCDVASEASVEGLAERTWSALGRVDLLFANAGVSAGAPVLDASSKDLHWLFGVNVFGVWHACAAFGRRFRTQGTPAHIVITGSEHSLGVPHLNAGLYTATKHAVLGLADVLRRELAPDISVSILCPGVVRTDLWRAGRHRPKELGGPTESPELVRAILAEGLDPLAIGECAVAGVERGDFYIMTHPHARRYAEERSREILDAFDCQAPYREGDDRYDVNAIVGLLLSRQ